MSRYIWKLCGVSFAFGGALEFVMIKTGFCKIYLQIIFYKYNTSQRQQQDCLRKLFFIKKNFKASL